MTKAEIEKHLSASIGKPKVIALANQLVLDGNDLKELIDVTFHKDEGIGFRAVWVLENIFLDHPDAFLPHIPYFLDRFKDVTNPGCKRHYSKITMHLMEKQAPDNVKQFVSTLELEPAIEKCFDWMIDPEVKVAVKVYAAEALFAMRKRYDWIADELKAQLQFMMREGGTFANTAGKRLLQALAKDK
ncbi:hypothetical protein [Mucilaginibacter myungsuensis]|uniref:Uncharacterized protein n=1 Tax=Mucilaginibacter myungsuensis TaxID=649104 RepID=A0A929KSY8_9SPHI|nr:hypothetical protein [Mucilaginibacter myungsuensis]MBE9660597.1 hypothetical protein [Mucilaginibacter myungsuensis]